jgi:uncharacterized protein (TIGR02757 family)
MTDEKLKEMLDKLYYEYQRKYSSKDPVWILHSLNDTRDIEIMGLIVSSYSYGQVEQINKFTHSLLDRIGRKPHEFTINFNQQRDKKYLKGLYHRFNKDSDLFKLFSVLNKILIKYSSLQNLFLHGYDKMSRNIIPALHSFTSELREAVPFGKRSADKYFDYLIPDPLNNSTCKRLNLFLRWMVRKDEIDIGIWNKVSRSKLVMPVDVHIARVSAILKLVKRKSIDLKFAVELTERLKQFDNDDPVRYDFSLCHIGMEKKLHLVL